MKYRKKNHRYWSFSIW